MNITTEQLIARLVADAKPVRCLRPPIVRAVRWLLAVAAAAALSVLLFSDLGVFAHRAGDPMLVMEMTGTLLTGILAVLAAFEMSLPERSSAWAVVPLPSFALWVTSSGVSCYDHWLVIGPNGWALGRSVFCLSFILAVSVPLGISLFLLLRHAAPLTPVRVGAIGGLGTAAIAAFMLQFFHPFDVTFIDLGVNLGAVALVIAIAMGTERVSGGFSPSRQVTSL